MNKRTVFRYEIKRLMYSKEYLLLLIVVLVYSMSLLRGVVIYGVNYTAPFSLLTFGTYCFSLSPFYFVLLLVLCARQFRTSERGAEAIICTTSMPFHIFRLIRLSAIGCAFLVAISLPFIACFVFYSLVFDYTFFGTLLLQGMLIIIPPAIFLSGISMLLGKRNPAAVYILLVAVLIISVFKITLPAFIDINGSALVQALSQEHFLALSSGFVAGRIVLLTVGMISVIVSVCRPNKRHA
ncbi:MAG TPA: hypothetical protein VIL05_13965 [Thermoclostridium sp.]